MTPRDLAQLIVFLVDNSRVAEAVRESVPVEVRYALVFSMGEVRAIAKGQR